MSRSSVLVLATLALASCPVGVEFPLGTPGTEKIDKKLLGTWRATDAEHEVQRVRISKRDKTSYDLEVLQKGELFAADATSFTGWVTKVDGQRFLYANAQSSDEYFTYAYDFAGKDLVVSNVALLVGGIDAVTSTAAYRAEVSASLKLPKGKVDPVTFTRE